MANVPYVTRIRTSKGEAQIDYNALANLPKAQDLESMGAVPNTRTINGKSLASDITLTADNVGAVPANRKINGKELTSDITISAGDINAAEKSHNHSASEIGAVPTSRKVNGKELSSDITLSAEDIGAALANHTHDNAGGSVTVDSALSSTSENPVQNKVVHAAIENLNQNKVGLDTVIPMANGGTNATNGAVGLKNLFAAGYTVLSSKQYGDDFPAGYTHSSSTKGTFFLKKVNTNGN